MRRTILAPILGAIVLLGSMLPATALGSVGGADGLAGQPAVAGTPTGDLLTRRIRLGCVLVRPEAPAAADPAAAVAAAAIECRWSAVDSARVRVYQVWRIKDAADGGQRRLVARIRADAPLAYTDARVSAGHTYTYKVVARTASGRRIAVSRLVTVRFPVPDEVLRLACAVDATADEPAVTCKWSEATHPRAARYVLWRSVDGGARERIYRTGLDGRRTFTDTDVEAGQAIRYVVVVKSRAGHRVGRGGPVVVAIPPVVAAAPALVVAGAR